MTIYLNDKAPDKVVTIKIMLATVISVPLNSDFGFGSVRSHLIVTEISDQLIGNGTDKFVTKTTTFNFYMNCHYYRYTKGVSNYLYIGGVNKEFANLL